MSNCLICQEEVATSFGWTEFLGMSKPNPVCRSCERAFEKISGKICSICGREWEKVPLENRHGEICFDCHRWELEKETTGLLIRNRSFFSYNEHMKEVLALYKFRGDAIIAEAFQNEFRKAYDMYYRKEHPVLVPIPLGVERLYQRGFNQSLLLAKLIAPIDITEPLAKNDSVKQSKKDRKGRLQQENPFYVTDTTKVRGRNILLIDDIYTTGTTIRMAAKVLKAAGAAEISSLTLVRS